MTARKLIKPVIFGITGGIILLAIFFIVMGTGSGSPDYTLKELIRLRFWIGALVLGFATQIGLLIYLKEITHARLRKEKGTAIASTATSTTAMLACCVHHLTDLLPFLGLSVAGGFLIKYQEWFLTLGIFSNIFGSALMFVKIKKFKKYEN